MNFIGGSSRFGGGGGVPASSGNDYSP